ncbi:response regulator [Psychroserpens sp. SPM9]|uniref:response regulator n=1 Tax=Psychroserpens sp. SPM9 TaxID=2975598 RepID=UPI0021A603FF|nr:response regulator [Psychroserpens sp. SPM9]MDG5491220.1 response regulator [Psychroserpens sp. SPM9]
MVKCFGLVLFLVSFCTVTYGQKPSNYIRDSIQTIEKHEQFETTLHTDILKAKTYLETLHHLSLTSTYPKTSYYFHHDSGNYYFVVHDLKSSQKHYQKAYNIATALSYNKDAITDKIWLANLKYFQGKYSASKQMYHEILNEAIAENYLDGIANAYYGLASMEIDKKQVLNWLIKVDSVYTNADTVSPILANANEVMGKIYLETYQNKQMAKVYFNKALEISKSINYQDGIQSLHVTLGKLSFEDGNYKQAYAFFNELLHYDTLKNDTLNIARDFSELARIDIQTNNFNTAEERLQIATSYFEKLSDTVSQINVSLMFTELYIKSENIVKATQSLNQVELLSFKLDNYNFTERYYTNTIALFELKGDYKQALLKQKALDSFKTESLNKQNTSAFLNLERQYESEKKAKEIELLKSKNQLVFQEKAHQRNLLLGAIALATLTGLFFFFLYRNRQKTNIKLKVLDRFKSKFFANISHEFRTPLTLISGPIERRLDAEGLSSADRSEFEMIQRNSNRLLSLVDQLLDLSKLEAGKFKLKVQEGDLTVLLKSIAASFQYLAAQKQINYQLDIQKINKAWFDKDVIEKIVTNLLSNAFKYSKNETTIKFKALSNGNDLEMTIENEGTIITKETIDAIFNRFYQSDETKDGVGIGLSLVKELVDLIHGNITVENTKHHRILFTVKIPIIQQSFKSTETILESSTSESRSKPLISNDSEDEVHTIDEDLPILLIVEDHQDVRLFIKKEFKTTYQILEAENGEDGLKKAIQFVPDIILTDVMMPKMTGFELLTRLKTDEKTSHIPIILLTAKVEEEDQFKGLETGADDYITKPFKMSLLKKRIENLVASRAKLRERYSQELILKPKDITITSFDEQFLEKVATVIDNNLSEASYSVDDFSKAVGMSRMQLHRKLKALTGQSATEFIRTQRLKLAASLLKKSDINISEIGYMVGFNNHSYFTKCFKEAYGCSPTEFISK